MSKFVGIVIGAIEVGIGIATGNVALIVSGALMIASSTATLLLTPSADISKRLAQQTTLQLGEVPRQGVLGETAVGGSLVDAANWGGTYGTDWEGQIRALADHKCEGLTGFFVNDTFVSYTGDGVVPGYNNQLEVYFRDGSEVQTLPAIVTDHFPGWTAADYGAGVCYVVFAYKADEPDQDNPTWPGGRPQFLPVVKGKLCYQARLDSTVAGGSGPHRWNDPSTWEWTDNPIDCRYNWSRGIYACDRVDQPDMLLVGRGLSEAEQPPANVAAPANLCDELVGSEKQFRIDGVIAANEKFIDVEERFAVSVAGQVVTREGAVEIEPAQAKAPSFAFTDLDILSGTEKAWNGGFLSDADSDWVNTVVARYVEPDQKWKDHAAPVRRDIDDVIADRGPREASVSLDMVKRASQAGVVAEIYRRIGRLWGRATVTLGPRFAGVEEGDWGTWTSDRHFGGATKTFRVEAYQVDGSWRNRLQLREISSSVFTGVPGLVDTSGTFEPTPPPTLVAPSASDWTLTATQVQTSTGLIPALQLDGAVSMSAVEYVKFEARVYSAGRGDDDNWGSPVNGVQPPNVTSERITVLAANTDYQVSVRYRVSGEWTPRLILGPVTTGGSSYITTLIRNSGTADLKFACDSSGNVTVSSHQRIYDDVTVSVDGTPGTAADGTGGTPIVTAAAAGKLVLVFYDQQSRAGGAVTYQYLVISPGDDDSAAYASSAHPYRHFVLFAQVPASGSVGGGGAVGTGGGGAGAGGGYINNP